VRPVAPAFGGTAGTFYRAHGRNQGRDDGYGSAATADGTRVQARRFADNYVVDIDGQWKKGRYAIIVAPLGHATDPWHIRVAASDQGCICSSRWRRFTLAGSVDPLRASFRRVPAMCAVSPP
jgi:hypothetical protein